MRTLASCAFWAILGAAAVFLLRGTVTGDGSRVTTAPAGTEAPPPVIRATGGNETRSGTGDAAAAIVDLANRDPVAAMTAALARPGYWQRIDTVERIAALWSRSDPEAALAYAHGVRIGRSDIYHAFHDRVLDVWAATDPDGAMGYLLSPQARQTLFVASGGGYKFARGIAASRAEQLLVAADSFPPGRIRATLRAAAIESLVASDPAAALRETWPGPVDEDRRQWIDAVAAVYPQRDPVAALEWARALDGAPRTLRAVARAVHSAVPARTRELGLCEIDLTIDPVCRR